MRGGLIEWLGFNRNPNYRKSQALGGFLGFLFLFIIIAYLVLTVVLFVKVFSIGFGVGIDASSNQGADIRNYGLVLAAFVGAPFLVWRTVLTARQTSVSEEIFFNDRFNAAAEDLFATREVTEVEQQQTGSHVVRTVEDDLVRRQTGIDRISSLATERKEMAPRAARLLAAYIRSNFPTTSLESTDDLKLRRIPRSDLSFSIDVISKILPLALEVDKSDWRLNLTSCDLSGIVLNSGCFRGVSFDRSRLEGCIFHNVDFSGANFYDCLLSYADFFKCNLVGAKFERVKIDRPVASAGGYFNPFHSSNMKGVSFAGADLSAVTYLGGAEAVSETFGDADTQMCYFLYQDYPTEEDLKLSDMTDALPERDFSDADIVLANKVKETGFQNWSPYQSNDMATNHKRHALYEKLGLLRFPYWG